MSIYKWKFYALNYIYVYFMNESVWKCVQIFLFMLLYMWYFNYILNCCVVPHVCLEMEMQLKEITCTTVFPCRECTVNVFYIPANMVHTSSFYMKQMKKVMLISILLHNQHSKICSYCRNLGLNSLWELYIHTPSEKCTKLGDSIIRK